MTFDYKKEYKEFYMPKKKPAIVEIPSMNYIAVRGKGDPNPENSEYKASIGLLYAIAFTIKMSKLGDHKIDGYFDYVVPPLEGFWWQYVPEEETEEEMTEGKAVVKEARVEGTPAVEEAVEETPGEESPASSKRIRRGIDYTRKEDFHFLSMIRLPDFVTKEDFDWAIEEATKKKKQDFSKVEFLTYKEGLCVQCMHVGPYDDEPETIKRMHDFMETQGYELDITDKRFHHEIYLSDARRAAPEKLKTVIRHPVKKR